VDRQALLLERRLQNRPEGSTDFSSATSAIRRAWHRNLTATGRRWTPMMQTKSFGHPIATSWPIWPTGWQWRITTIFPQPRAYSSKATRISCGKCAAMMCGRTGTIRAVRALPALVNDPTGVNIDHAVYRPEVRQLALHMTPVGNGATRTVLRVGRLASGSWTATANGTEIATSSMMGLSNVNDVAASQVGPAEFELDIPVKGETGISIRWS